MGYVENAACTAVNLLLSVRIFLTAFLSCLYGSEQFCCRFCRATPFLSCLYGSEHNHNRRPAELIFLSCLYGSEQVKKRVGLLA